MKSTRALLAGLLFFPTLALAQSFQSFKNGSTANLGAPYLLTDGTVLIQNNFTTGWVKLTPDQNGSYVNGTWSNAASLPAGYSPFYYAAAVLADGRLVIIGGEDNYAGSATYSDTNLGAIYDPKSDTWTPILPPTSWANIGDSPSVVLPNGQFLLGDGFSTQLALLDPATLTWTAASNNGKITSNNEEGFTLLPDGTVLDVNVSSGGATQRFLPSTGQWISAGSTPQPLESGGEMGPAMLRPNGTVFAMGASGANAVYTPPSTLTGTGTWAAAPSLAIGDAPACLLPDGNVLVEANTGFYEFDGTNLTQVVANTEAAYAGRLLLLPNGQVLFTAGGGQIYTPSGTPNPAWAPTITSFPATIGPGATYSISGTQFNGLSQAVAYGDDYQAATNYPLVRIKNNSTGHVFYARTHDHSTMAVATGSATVSTNFDVPANIELGPSSLVVVANGIPSTPVSVTVQPLGSSTTTLSSSLNPSAGGQAVTFTAAVTASGSATGTVTFLDGVMRLGTGTLNGSGVTTFTTSSLIVGSHSVTAVYAGDTNFTSSTSGSVTQTVSGAATSTTLTSSLNPSGSNVSTTFTATITGSGGTPTGSVAFFDGASWLASATLTSGTASFSVSALPAGSHSITVRYSGDTSFEPSTSNTLTQMVDGSDASSTALTSSLNPSTKGQSVTFTASVTGTGGGTPTGTVTFLDGTNSLGTATLNASAQAPLTVSALTVGSHSISATYSGNATYTSSTSSAVTQVVNGAPATIVLTSSPNPSVSGQPVTLTATVSGSSGTPAGSVTFLDGSTSLGTCTLNASGVATFATSTLASGSQSITAQYAGDAEYSSETSSAISQSVQDFSLPSTPPNVSISAAGQTENASISITPVSGFTGTVTFSCTVPASMREASCSATSAQITGSAGATSALTITTTGPHQLASGTDQDLRSRGTVGTLLAGCLLFGVAALRRRRLGASLVLLLFLGSLCIFGCAGGGSGSGSGGTQTDQGTPAGTYTVILTGTSGTASHSVNVSVAVQ